MTQPSLFDDSDFASLPSNQPLARKADPVTSHIAASDIIQSLAELHRWARKCVLESPGMTQRELGVRYCPEDLRKIGRRLNEIEKAGSVRRGMKRHCRVSGRLAETWWPA